MWECDQNTQITHWDILKESLPIDPTGSSALDALQDCLQHDTFQEELISKLSFNGEEHEGKGRDDGNKSLI